MDNSSYIQSLGLKWRKTWMNAWNSATATSCWYDIGVHFGPSISSAVWHVAMTSCSYRSLPVVGCRARPAPARWRVSATAGWCHWAAHGYCRNPPRSRTPSCAFWTFWTRCAEGWRGFPVGRNQDSRTLLSYYHMHTHSFRNEILMNVAVNKKNYKKIKDK